nr:transposase [Danio rerio]
MMERFLKNPAPASNLCKSDLANAKAKSRKYDKSYIAFGFTCTLKQGVDRPQCVLCQEILSNECMKPSKVKRHLQQKHPNEAEKSTDYFKHQEMCLARQASLFRQQASVPERCLKASYLASLHIARAKKPHTVGEALLLSATKDIVKELFGEEAARKIDCVPLSDNTVGRRISEMADDISSQLLEQLQASEYFSLQLDESTDIANQAQLMVYVRFLGKDTFIEELLFCKPLEGRTTGQDICNMMDQFMTDNSVDWSRCIGVCTDGAAAMTGKHSGVVTLIKEKAPNVVGTHCMLHREALVAKRIEDDLHQVLKDVIRTVNYVKSRPLKHRLFRLLCKEMGADYEGLLLHSEVRWLSRGAVLSRVYALRKELREFLSDENLELAKCFKDDTWILKLSCMADFFQHLSFLNQSMQGHNVHILNAQDKVRAFTQKLSLWESKLEEGVTEMFPLYNQERISTTADNITPIIQSHLSHLQGYFKQYFPDLNNNHLDFVRDPFAPGVGTYLDLAAKEQLIDLSNDGGRKTRFPSLPLSEFWMSVREDYPMLSEKAIKCLLPFATTYLCEAGFSALKVLQSKHRARLEVESDMRLALTKMKPRYDKLCRSHQAHPSH